MTKQKIKVPEGPKIVLTTKGKKVLADYKKLTELMEQFEKEDYASSGGDDVTALILDEIFQGNDIVPQTNINDSSELNAVIDGTDYSAVYNLYHYIKPLNEAE